MKETHRIVGIHIFLIHHLCFNWRTEVKISIGLKFLFWRPFSQKGD